MKSSANNPAPGARPQITDPELMADLDCISAEVARRRAASPAESFASWALSQRLAAFVRYEQRVMDRLPGGKS